MRLCVLFAVIAIAAIFIRAADADKHNKKGQEARHKAAAEGSPAEAKDKYKKPKQKVNINQDENKKTLKKSKKQSEYDTSHENKLKPDNEDKHRADKGKEIKSEKDKKAKELAKKKRHAEVLQDKEGGAPETSEPDQLRGAHADGAKNVCGQKEEEVTKDEQSCKSGEK